MHTPQYPQKISEKCAKALAKTTQRGTVPRLGRFLTITLESGERVLLKRISPRRYVLLFQFSR